MPSQATPPSIMTIRPAAATRQSILSWWEERGEPVVRQALVGESFVHEGSSRLWKDLRTVYAHDAVYQDAFIVTPPSILAVYQSFVLIGSFWDVRVESLGPARVLQPASSVSKHDATLRIPYSLSQRAKILQWLPWWHHYAGYIDLHLQQDCQGSTVNPLLEWKIKKHDDRMLVTLPWSKAPTNMTDCLTSIPLVGIVFQSFREFHGRAVQALAARRFEP